MVGVWGKMDGNLRKQGLEHPLVQKVIGPSSTLGSSDEQFHNPHKKETSTAMAGEYDRLPAVIDDCINSWIAQHGTEGIITKPYEDIDDLTIDIFTRWFLHHSFTQPERQEITGIWEALERYGNINIPAAMQLDKLSPYIPGLGNSFYNSIEKLYMYAQQVIDTSNSPFLQRYLQNEQFSQADIRDEVAQMLLAGHTSIATSVTWSLLTLGQPEMQPLADELSDGDATQMHYYYQEMLRLYPPVYVATRQTTEIIEVKDHNNNIRELPAHSHVFLGTYFLHRNPRIWGNDVLQVDPSRHSGHLHKGQFTPFGVGPRRCIGEKASYMIAEHVLQRLSRQYKFTASNKPKPRFRVTMRPRSNTILAYESRN